MESLKLLWILILVYVSLETVSTAVDSLPECVRNKNNSRVEWRVEKQTFTLTLNSSNVACYSGEKCSNQSQKSKEVTSTVSIIVQSGDEIELFIDLYDTSDNGTSKISLLSRPESSMCDNNHHKTLLSVDSRNMTLRDDVLQPGELNAFVHFSDEGLECDILWSLQIKIQEHECSKSKDQSLCSGKGFCDNFSNTGSFSCRCCAGFVGKYCEERDGCYGNPCQHGGFCVDIAEGLVGTTFQCLCPHGYRGRSCEGEVSLCDRKPCLNNGTCTGNQTEYTCECPKGFAGADCETNVNECLSNPCVHGVCEDGDGGYKCYCLPGYGGDHCEFEYDECDSSPCINGGACEDLVAGYRCHCGPGYQGRRCQIKVDLCQPNPCLSPAQCVDRGNNYSCICHPGYNGPGCTQHYDPCYPNPCQNGGSCWPSLDSYFCSCNPGFTGDLCEEAMVAAQPLPRTLEDPGEPDEGGHHGESLDRWHNLYLVGTMLSMAAALVGLVAVVCHCRINKTYQRFTRKIGRSCSDLKQQKLPRQVFIESSWERF
ncbi:delta and Notch-like epidermal growth factor-related receptor isoform X2 [Parasteatoda tepidariorum]|uniref:delta and Notch-like epidermal growth factor-related receptor isoform X2 n=1 Tax=Parasteatoda tepidariorum TaxID=114398 RepID=UPI00077F9AD4|nr:fibropellin-1 isoform X2 [Parasteatoda tepidariorum]